VCEGGTIKDVTTTRDGRVVLDEFTCNWTDDLFGDGLIKEKIDHMTG
jgi:hypothetical protein